MKRGRSDEQCDEARSARSSLRGRKKGGGKRILRWDRDETVVKLIDGLGGIGQDCEGKVGGSASYP